MYEAIDKPALEVKALDMNKFEAPDAAAPVAL